MLSEAEIKQYLSLAKTDVLSKMKSGKGYEIVPGVFVKSMAEARDQLTRLSKMYALMDESTLNDRVFEEYLADEFEKFKTNPRSTSIASTIKSFFNKIIAMIKHVFYNIKRMKYRIYLILMTEVSLEVQVYKTIDLQTLLIQILVF